MEAPRRSLLLALALFLAFHGLYGLSASGRVNRIPDEFEVYLQCEALVDRGSLAIACPEALFYGQRGRDGQQYAPYGPGSAFLALPHHLLGRALAAGLGLDRDLQRAGWTELVACVTSLANATWGALAVVGLYATVLALGAGRRRAALLGCLLGLGTALWPYATVFYSEPQSAALLTGFAACWLHGRRWAAASLFALLLLVKVSNICFIPAAAVLALGSWREPAPAPRLRTLILRLLPVGLAVALAGSVHLGWNLWRFAEPLNFGYSFAGILREGEVPRRFVLSELPRGLFILLLSPGKSLFLFAPPLLLAAARWRGFARARPLLGRTLAVLAISVLGFFGLFAFPEAGFCYGPRHLVPALPLLLLPLALGPLPRRALVAGCLVLGLWVQLLGFSVSFMEDQGLRPRADGTSWSPYYRLEPPSSPAVPPGRPLLRYRLDYAPLVRYPPLLLGHLRAGPVGSGRTGLEFIPGNLMRGPGGSQLPGWAPWLLWGSFWLPLAAGLGLWGWSWRRGAQPSG